METAARRRDEQERTEERAEIKDLSTVHWWHRTREGEGNRGEPKKHKASKDQIMGRGDTGRIDCSVLNHDLRRWVLGSLDSSQLWWWHWHVALLFDSFPLCVLRSDSLALLRLVVRQLTLPIPQAVIRLNDLVDFEEIKAFVHISLLRIPVPLVPIRPATEDERTALIDLLDDGFPTLYSEVGFEHIYLPPYEELPVYSDAFLSWLEVARDASEVEPGRLVDGVDVCLLEREHDEDAAEEDFVYAH